jgi:hypothetical protein
MVERKSSVIDARPVPNNIASFFPVLLIAIDLLYALI